MGVKSNSHFSLLPPPLPSAAMVAGGFHAAEFAFAGPANPALEFLGGKQTFDRGVFSFQFLFGKGGVDLLVAHAAKARGFLAAARDRRQVMLVGLRFRVVMQADRAGVGLRMILRHNGTILRAERLSGQTDCGART